MALIIEDGTNVANAVSIVDAAYVLAYAQARMREVPGASKLEAYIIRAMDYFTSYRALLQGSKTYSDQTLQLPRCGMTIDGVCFPKDQIPVEGKNAIAELVCIMVADDAFEVWPVATGGFVIHEKVDVIETTYSETVSNSGLPRIPSFDAMMQPLLQNSSGFALRTVRV